MEDLNPSIVPLPPSAPRTQHGPHVLARAKKYITPTTKVHSYISDEISKRKEIEDASHRSAFPPAEREISLYKDACRSLEIHPKQSIIDVFRQGVPGGILDFSKDYIGDVNLIALSQALDATSLPIIEIYLNHNGIENPGVVCLCNVLKGSDHIRRVSLSYNNISDRAGKALLDLIESCPSLHSVDVIGTSFGQEIAVKIFEAMERRHYQ
ncbi:hypothetical protein ADUPG1_014079 [Aduncisulcus paluster]|uniref:Uncharacterized protein n=1 Tax=Aduncisulcus paluster TaxID=2918883 RepID=A0ABQ5K9M8_9EUKA|nr:hypothetical protein ADUPG1_014079 [Aduncisulcus paluster]